MSVIRFPCRHLKSGGGDTRLHTEVKVVPGTHQDQLPVSQILNVPQLQGAAWRGEPGRGSNTLPVRSLHYVPQRRHQVLSKLIHAEWSSGPRVQCLGLGLVPGLGPGLVGRRTHGVYRGAQTWRTTAVTHTDQKCSPPNCFIFLSDTSALALGRHSSVSARPWMDSLDPETLYLSPEQHGQPGQAQPELSLLAPEGANMGG
ncbi:hypothetical protein N1851_032389 [Merluccius polli]|uniref:Uncharacterized protein n=1 Tax=Merluccius polli TaxID=89951 RepID=A0AA47M327_MERPO|nr:hypothetical protein N1851_032389 [Merluccius polli]